MKIDKVIKSRTSVQCLVFTTVPPITPELVEHIAELAPQANLQGVKIECNGIELVVAVDSLKRITPQLHSILNQMLDAAEKMLRAEQQKKQQAEQIQKDAHTKTVEMVAKIFGIGIQ